MRKETEKIAASWWQGKRAKAARTWTDGESIFLHGNKIAWRDKAGFHLTLSGWPTVTTRERLNGILNVMGAYKAGFYQSGGNQYFTNLLGESREISASEVITIRKKEL